MIERLEFFLADRGIYMLTFVLLAIGIYGMIICGNYMKKLMCMNVVQVSVIFFFLTFGQKDVYKRQFYNRGNVKRRH